ncbi:MAG: sulfotransferase domain-containing protein [Candidatus Competibacterales bacterium]
MVATAVKPLDFIVIGAQKAGTTSLFEYLRPHPALCLPAEKELPFFVRDDLLAQGWEAVAARHFAGAKDHQRWGTASPQYMGDPRAPARIAAAFPEVKLIALLRNPIQRTYSHYQMSCRRGLESRPFARVVEEALDPAALAAARRAPAPDYAAGYLAKDPAVNRFYVVWSEYGRILDHFAQHFAPTQFHLVYTEALQQQPREVLRGILAFLDVDAEFVPPNLGTVYHRGGGRPWVPQALRRRIMALGPVRALWSRVPGDQQGRLRRWYERLNVRPKAAEPGPGPLERQRLAEHFRADVAALVTRVGRPAPWPEFP